MYLTRALLTALAFSLLSACATTANTNASAQDASRRELKALSDAWDQAIVNKNRAAIEANMAADFSQIAESGAVATREQFIAAVTDANLTIHPYQVEEFGIRLYGDVALLSGRIHLSGTASGSAFTSDFRYIDIYARRDGKWQVVSVQLTPVAK